MTDKTRTPHGQKQFEKKREADSAMSQYDAEGRAVRANLEKARARVSARRPPRRVGAASKAKKAAAKPAKKEAPASSPTGSPISKRAAFAPEGIIPKAGTGFRIRIMPRQSKRSVRVLAGEHH